MPDFELPDQEGKAHSLQSLLGPQGALLLFYRSADWSPDSKAQLVELEQNQGEFRKLGLGVAGISYDSVAVSHNFAERKGIHFPLLSDPDSKIVRKLGILDQTTPRDSVFFGSPHPGSFLVNARGIIVAKYFEDDSGKSYTAASILLHRFGVVREAAKTAVEGRQLALTASASNAIVGPGQRIALAVDIELKPNMHVYAPGVDGYIPIDWKMKDSSGEAAQTVSYPASHKLFLKAINETVPVYRDRFRLTRDITILSDEESQPKLDGSGHFTLEGTLRYQACDDRVCYIPQQLPLQWTFQYESLDRERVPQELQRKAPGIR
jgi:peroxiredoxin